MFRTTRHLIAILVGVLLVGAIASHAGAQGSWVTSPAAQSLYEKAKAEKEVVIWGPDDDELNWIAAPFNKRFPGIEVKASADRAATTKAIAESRAGRHAVDVFLWSLGGILPLQERAMLGPNDWALWGVNPDDVFFGGNAAASHNLLYAVVYNSDRVKESELPKTWEGFLDPRFKGKLFASDFLMPRFLGFMALAWGEDKTLEFFRALRDRAEIQIVSGNAPRDAILKSGERLISIGDFVSNAVLWKSHGVPAAWHVLSPTGSGQFVVTPLAKAPHQSAAKLLAGWISTDEAKETRERRRFVADLRPGSRSKLAAQFRSLGLKIVYEDVANMKQRADYYNKFSPIVSGQQK